MGFGLSLHSVLNRFSQGLELYVKQPLEKVCRDARSRKISGEFLLISRNDGIVPYPKTTDWNRNKKYPPNHLQRVLYRNIFVYLFPST